MAGYILALLELLALFVVATLMSLGTVIMADNAVRIWLAARRAAKRSRRSYPDAI